jgi:hypothetical protein
MLGMMYRKIDDFVDFQYVSNLAIFAIGVSVFVPAVKNFTQSLNLASITQPIFG